jgi:cyclopropane fatty-acyl-phospholipid synthase-like methyltransferase
MPMSNEQSLIFHGNLAAQNLTEENVYSGKLGRARLDVDFLRGRLKLRHRPRLLDLGTGTGAIINEVIASAAEITCVEMFPAFSQHIKTGKKVRIITANIRDFNSKTPYDLISCFGVLHYFTREEVTKIYHRLFEMTELGGEIIVKNQFGVYEDVNVSGYSEKLGTDYFASYRSVDSEMNLLKEIGFQQVIKHDIYPEAFNQWDNTHYYGLTALR